jgi:hypothetical protein
MARRLTAGVRATLMRLIAKLIVVAVFTCSPLVASAATLYGLGAKTCGTWLEKRCANDHFDMAQWMLGYISAANYYTFDFKESEGAAFIAYMDNYCQQNPLEKFSVGVRRLIDELQKKANP